MMRMARAAWPRRLAWAYIELFQGTPLLMQLFLAFFGLALAGIDVPAWLAAYRAGPVVGGLPGRNLARLRGRHPHAANGRRHPAWR